jgi:hypothetical protein
VARFQQEARAVSALNHPNVCTIYALGEVQVVKVLDFGLAKRAFPSSARHRFGRTRSFSTLAEFTWRLPLPT